MKRRRKNTPLRSHSASARKPKNQPHKLVPSLDTTQEVEQILNSGIADAKANLKTLVDAGCDRDRILSLLLHMRETAPQFDNWRGLTGMNRQPFRRFLANSRHWSERINRFNDFPLVWRLMGNRPLLHIHLMRLPSLLNSYADELEKGMKLYKPRGKVTLNGYKRDLVQHVRKRTKRVYDYEVSTLIASILENYSYGSKAHEVWRRQQPSLRILKSTRS